MTSSTISVGSHFVIERNSAGVTGGQVARTTVADVITAVIGDPDGAKGLTLEFNDGEQPIDGVIAG